MCDAVIIVFEYTCQKYSSLSTLSSSHQCLFDAEHTAITNNNINNNNNNNNCNVIQQLPGALSDLERAVEFFASMNHVYSLTIITDIEVNVLSNSIKMFSGQQNTKHSTSKIFSPMHETCFVRDPTNNNLILADSIGVLNALLNTTDNFEISEKLGNTERLSKRVLFYFSGHAEDFGAVFPLTNSTIIVSFARIWHVFTEHRAIFALVDACGVDVACDFAWRKGAWRLCSNSPIIRQQQQQQQNSSQNIIKAHRRTAPLLVLSSTARGHVSISLSNGSPFSRAIFKTLSCRATPSHTERMVSFLAQENYLAMWCSNTLVTRLPLWCFASQTQFEHKKQQQQQQYQSAYVCDTIFIHILRNC